MPYTIIQDDEVDPGSPINSSLLYRLRDNPYAIPSSLSIDGGAGVTSPVGRLASSTPAVPTVFDDQGIPAGDILTIGGASVGQKTGIAACPRSTVAHCGAFISVYSAIYNNDLVAASWQSNNYAMSGVYSGGTPTHLRVSPWRKYDGNVWPYVRNFGTISGPLSTYPSSIDLPIGGGWTKVLQHDHNATSIDIFMNSTVDTDVFYVGVKMERNITAYSQGDADGQTVRAGSAYTGQIYAAQPLIGG